MALNGVRNPLFARLLVWMRRHESREEMDHRRELLADVSGRVIDVGAGDGANFRHFPPTVEEVIAIEPEPYLRERAQRGAEKATVPIRVVDAVADRLPFENESVDVAVVCLVLCSVPDQATALRELHRVLRPGGELRFYEHVIARNRRVARVQRFLQRTGIWPRLAGGCHPARDTTAAIEAAGFAIIHSRRMAVTPCPILLPVAPHVLGVARRPETPTRAAV